MLIFEMAPGPKDSEGGLSSSFDIDLEERGVKITLLVQMLYFSQKFLSMVVAGLTFFLNDGEEQEFLLTVPNRISNLGLDFSCSHLSFTAAYSLSSSIS